MDDKKLLKTTQIPCTLHPYASFSLKSLWASNMQTWGPGALPRFLLIICVEPTLEKLKSLS